MANRIEVRRKRDLDGYRVVVRDGVPIGRVKVLARRHAAGTYVLYHSFDGVTYQFDLMRELKDRLRADHG